MDAFDFRTHIQNLNSSFTQSYADATFLNEVY
jgi:hypothetical protein